MWELSIMCAVPNCEREAVRLHAITDDDKDYLRDILRNRCVCPYHAGELDIISTKPPLNEAIIRARQNAYLVMAALGIFAVAAPFAAAFVRDGFWWLITVACAASGLAITRIWEMGRRDGIDWGDEPL